MNAHQLARKLLSGPDLPVKLCEVEPNIYDRAGVYVNVDQVVRLYGKILLNSSEWEYHIPSPTRKKRILIPEGKADSLLSSLFNGKGAIHKLTERRTTK